MQDILKKLRAGHFLTPAEMGNSVTTLLNGDATPAQAGAFLMSLSQRGETVDEIVAAARILRAKATTIHTSANAFNNPVASPVDCCGTGGDHFHSYNISTAVSFVVAACGIPVAKHGNRAASSQCGAADVLEHLGVNLDLSPLDCETALAQMNFCFLMAPRFHASLKPLAGLRKELGFRTIFNLLGPLANPAGTSRQLLGVFDKHWVRPMAEALLHLGSTAALVVHGDDGLDEITLTGDTHCALLQGGVISEFTLTPDDFGLPVIRGEDIKGGDAPVNARALSDVLNGQISAYRHIVLANAAAVLYLSGYATDWKDGVRLAAMAIDNGSALRVLRDYISFSQGRKTAS